MSNKTYPYKMIFWSISMFLYSSFFFFLFKEVQIVVYDMIIKIVLVTYMHSSGSFALRDPEIKSHNNVFYILNKTN